MIIADQHAHIIIVASSTLLGPLTKNNFLEIRRKMHAANIKQKEWNKNINQLKSIEIN